VVCHLGTPQHRAIRSASFRSLPLWTVDDGCIAGAIFLSALVLITQNRLSEESEHRADLHLHVGLLAEHKLTRVLQMLGAIQDKLGIADHAASELADLEMETKPEDVMAEIERLRRSAIRQRNRFESSSSARP